MSDIFAPVSGKVLDVNGELATSPEVVNSDPYGLGWMVKMELTNPSELDSLLSAEDYKQLIGK